MHKLRYVDCPRLTLPNLTLLLLLVLYASASVVAQAVKTDAPAAGTPSDTVRQFYRALSEKRFRDALRMSVYRNAIEGLSSRDLEELRPDFEGLAVGAEKVEIKGEQISGDRATVFVKLKDDAPATPPLPVQLRKIGGNWIIYDEEVEKAIKRDGNKYFFNARIKAHEDEVESGMLVRIAQAQLVYSAQHNGTFADLPTLVKEKLLPEDVLSSQSTGYKFHITLAPGGKSYTAGAEPAIYGRTGMRSFFMDPTGVKSADTGGKPYTPPATKK